MRKSAKVILIIASSLVGIGIVFLGLSMAFGGVNVVFKSADYKVMSATFDEVEVLNIDDVSNDVRVIKSENNEVKVTYANSENFGYSLKQVDNSLQIEYHDFRQWYEFFGVFSLRDYELIVELPESTLEELYIKTVSGNIVAKDVLAKETTIKSTSGNIETGGAVGAFSANSTSGSIQLNSNTAAECVSVETVSGELRLSGDFGGDLNAFTTSGSINFSGCFATDAKLSTTSGDINAKALYLSSLEADTMSGDICLDDSTCANDMKLKTTSGDIELERVDAANYDLSSTSGEVDASILTAKIYNVKSTSGSINVPQSNNIDGGVLNAVTTSGDIEVKVIVQ